MLWKLWEEHSGNEFQERMLQQAIQDKEYLHILGVQEWKIPVHKYKVQLTAATKSKIDILKKMVMNAMLNMKVMNLDDLSEFLHVDSLFINDIVREMLVTGVVEKKNGTYILTKIGVDQYEAGTILSQPINEMLHFDYSCENEEVLLEEPTKNLLLKEEWDIDKFRYSSGLHSLEGIMLEEETLRQFVASSGKSFEAGGNEKVISKINPVELQGTYYAKCIEFQLYDILEDKAYARVWNGATSRWDEKLEEEINKNESESWKVKYDQEIIEYFPERYEYMRSKLKNYNTSTKGAKKEAEILRGKKIRDTFLQSFKNTKRKMLMVSPWISGHVIDKDMLDRLAQFAKQGKTLFISWGIAKSINQEDRKPSNGLLKQLTDIRHPDGTQAVFVRWFGNQHNKEIVIDQDTHLLGSFNWLSYRGEYDIRHESVVLMKDEKIIKDTTEYIELKFIQAIEKDIDDVISGSDFNQQKLKDLMKELISLDTNFEKRRELSTRLVDYLRSKEENGLVHVLSCMWILYNQEAFGSLEYLKQLLEFEKNELAKQYYQLSLKHIPTSSQWMKSPILQDYKEWMQQQINPSTSKKDVSKKQKGKGQNTEDKSKKQKSNGKHSDDISLSTQKKVKQVKETQKPNQQKQSKDKQQGKNQSQSTGNKKKKVNV